MERNTILAIVLASALILVYFGYQWYMSPPEKKELAKENKVNQDNKTIKEETKKENKKSPQVTKLDEKKNDGKKLEEKKDSKSKEAQVNGQSTQELFPNGVKIV